MGAPRDWAGFSRMVMVVSVSFRGASDSYSGIMGADKKKRIKNDSLENPLNNTFTEHRGK